MPKTYSPTFIAICKFISNVFNPLTSLFIFYVYYSIENLTLKEAFSMFLPILLILILPISIWIIWNVKKGKYSNMDVSNREQRKTLYVFIIAVSIIYLGYHYIKTGTLDLMMFYLLILLIIMQISNFYIKSSMHTALNIYVAALFFAVKPLFGIIWLILAIIVGLTRIVLKRHTPKEVLMGAILALSVSFVYLYHHIQIAISR